MALFAGCQIVLEFTMSVKLKEKTALKKCITSNGGVVSFIVTKNATHVICNDAEKAKDSYKCRMALKFGIPVVSMEFIHQCVLDNRILNTDDFIMVGKSKSEGLKEGKISASKFEKKDGQKKKMKSYVNVQGIKVWKDGDKNCPCFKKDFQIAKFATFSLQKIDRKKQQDLFAVLEVHVDDQFIPDNSAAAFKYRVTVHSGALQLVEGGGHIPLEYRFCNTVDEALAVYSHLYKEHEQKGFSVLHEALSRHIGSRKYRLLMDELGLESGTISEEVAELMEHVWTEAEGQIEEMLATPITRLKMEQVEKAEAILKQVKVAMETGDASKIFKLMKDFYDALPHHQAYIIKMPTKRWLSWKQDTVQMVKDVLTLSEATDWFTKSSVQSKYKTLRCNIQNLGKSSPEFLNMKTFVINSMSAGPEMKIENIFAVGRPVESINFRKKEKEEDEVRMMFHASKGENVVGILSRGLLLPKVVVDDHGGTRTDPGMLGSGIYFASSASTSLGYSSPSKVKGTRFMLITEVFLGRCKDYQQKDLSLTGPPEGYDSVHGVGGTGDFKNDEYVIYNTNQQCLRYLVEFSTGVDTVGKVNVDKEQLQMQQDSEEDGTDVNISLTDVKNIIDPMSKVKAGLVATGDDLIDLKSVHIRAKLVDLASEVIVLQEYVNNSKQHLEAKYVFPLGDMAAVCGFEAFINGKHIIGEVKEKETAHKEYKKAISEGHGAYLMDQDEETPDVFTVSVGNLPPGAAVLIKITYVAELQVEGELISFTLPGSVAPWKKESLKEVTQEKTDTVEVKQGETTVQISLNMPFDIRSLECPTNQVKVKRTSQRATIELQEDQSISDGFQLLIGLAEIHVPRMWVERKPENPDHQACMLTFFPEFEASEADDVNIVFLLDLSNSMKGDNLMNAKKILMLTLAHMSTSWNFNIVVFGTAFRELFPTCMPKSQSNMKIATQFIKNLSATMGNTEVIRPLQTFFLLRPENSMQNILLLSDGHVNNEEILLRQALQNCQHTRLFTMGVSSMANRHMLRALARVGAGAYEFFDAKAKSKWEGKVKSQLSKAGHPGLTSVRVDWEQHGLEGEPPVQAPKQITALFSGSRQVVTGFVPNCTMATLHANIAGDEVSTVVSTSELSITTGMVLHRLTARAMIRDWEDGMLSPDRTDHEIAKMTMKDYIIQLSKEYTIVTQLTSFVAIEKRDKDDEKRAVDAPAISELVAKECVDELTYMGFEEEKKQMVDCMKAVDELLTSVRLNFDSKTKQKNFLKEAFQYLLMIEDKSARQMKRMQLEIAFDEWELGEEFDFEGEFNQKRITPGEEKISELYLRTLTGKEMIISVTLDSTVEELKQQVQDIDGTPTDAQRLVFDGRQLEDWKRLSDYNIEHKSILFVLQRLRGGGEGPPPAPSLPPAVVRKAPMKQAKDFSLRSEEESADESSSDDSWEDDMDSDPEFLDESLMEAESEDEDSAEDESEEDDSEDDDMGFGLFSDSEDSSLHEEERAKGKSVKKVKELEETLIETRKIISSNVEKVLERGERLVRIDQKGEVNLARVSEAFCREMSARPPSPMIETAVLESAVFGCAKGSTYDESFEDIYEEFDDIAMDLGSGSGSDDPEPDFDILDLDGSPMAEIADTDKGLAEVSHLMKAKPLMEKSNKSSQQQQVFSRFQASVPAVQLKKKKQSKQRFDSFEESEQFFSAMPLGYASRSVSTVAAPMLMCMDSPKPPSPPPQPSSIATHLFGSLSAERTPFDFSRPEMSKNTMAKKPSPGLQEARLLKSMPMSSFPENAVVFGAGLGAPAPTLTKSTAFIGAPAPAFTGAPAHAFVDVPAPAFHFGGAPATAVMGAQTPTVRESSGLFGASKPAFMGASAPIYGAGLASAFGEAPAPVFRGAPPPVRGGAIQFGGGPPPAVTDQPLEMYQRQSLSFAIKSSANLISTSQRPTPPPPAPPYSAPPCPPPPPGSAPPPPPPLAAPPLEFSMEQQKGTQQTPASGRMLFVQQEILEREPVFRKQVAARRASRGGKASYSKSEEKAVQQPQVSWRKEGLVLGLGPGGAPRTLRGKSGPKEMEQELTEQSTLTFSCSSKSIIGPKEKNQGQSTLGVSSSLKRAAPSVKTLFDHGIGVKVPNILTGEATLLSNLQKVFEMQASTGEWSMSPELGQLLGVNFDLSQELLYTAGLKSLGLTATTNILKLVATIITMLSMIRMVIPQRLPADFSDEDMWMSLLEELQTKLVYIHQNYDYTECYSAAFQFCVKVDDQYPLVCSNLELGKSWQQFVGSMLKMHAPSPDRYTHTDASPSSVQKMVAV